jgi:hypothetical protein
MLKFKGYLIEGGNLPFHHETQGMRVSDSIDSSQRDAQQPEFLDFFHKLNDSFTKKHGHPLFGNALKTGSAFAGSARPYMDHRISTARFKNAKPSMGDMDIQIPAEHRAKLDAHIKPGQKIGKFKVVHVRDSGSQTHAIVQHPNGKFHQIDFEPVDYDKKTQEPTAFSQMAHNSHIDDMERGLKGVWHKKMLNAVFHAHAKEGLISTMKGRGKARAEQLEPGVAAPHSFSVDKGVRPRFTQTGAQGKTPIFKEEEKDDSKYTQDLPTIYKHMFNKKATDRDIEDLHSFGGVVNQIHRHIPKEHHQKIVDKFLEGLYHPSAQSSSVDPKEDARVKDIAYKELAHHFPQEVAARKDIRAQRTAYYDPKNPRSKFKTNFNVPSEEEHHQVNEAAKKDFHVAIGMGRFTGPTLEHQKLLDKVFAQKADAHHIFVMGPESHEQTTAKDPLTADEKVEQLKKLYPHKADSFVAGTHRHTKNPNKAMAWTWHQHQKPGRNVHLTVVGGSGDEGVASKSKAGGSADVYKNLLDKYNKTKFPTTEMPDGTQRGGDYRMNYASHRIVENPRGTVSGSVMRNFASSNDFNNPAHVREFKKMLHSGFSHDDAKTLMQKIKERSTKTAAPTNEEREAYVQGNKFQLKEWVLDRYTGQTAQIVYRGPTYVTLQFQEGTTVKRWIEGVQSIVVEAAPAGRLGFLDFAVEAWTPDIKQRMIARLHMCPDAQTKFASLLDDDSLDQSMVEHALDNTAHYLDIEEAAAMGTIDDHGISEFVRNLRHASQMLDKLGVLADHQPYIERHIHTMMNYTNKPIKEAVDRVTDPDVSGHPDDAALSEIEKHIDKLEWNDIKHLYADQNEDQAGEVIDEELTAADRMKKRMEFMKTKSKREIAARVARHRVSSPGKMKKRAIVHARELIMQRLLKGRSKSSLSAAEKSRIEGIVHRSKAAVIRISNRLVGKLRDLEKKRLMQHVREDNQATDLIYDGEEHAAQTVAANDTDTTGNDRLEYTKAHLGGNIAPPRPAEGANPRNTIKRLKHFRKLED